MLLSSLQPPLLKRSLQLQSFIATKTMTTQRVATGCIAATRRAVAPRKEINKEIYGKFTANSSMWGSLRLTPIIQYNIMFEFLGLAYRDSDYTAVIAIMH